MRINGVRSIDGERLPIFDRFVVTKIGNASIGSADGSGILCASRSEIATEVVIDVAARTSRRGRAMP